MKARIGYIFVVLLSLVSVASAQGKPEKEKIRIGYAARVVAHSVPYLTTRAGLFRDEGLQVDVVQTAGSVAPMALIGARWIFQSCPHFSSYQSRFKVATSSCW